MVTGTLGSSDHEMTSVWFLGDTKEVLAVRFNFEVLLQVGLNVIEYFGCILALVQLRI